MKKKSISTLLAALLFLTAVLSPCQTDTVSAAAKIRVSKAKVTVVKGDRITIKATNTGTKKIKAKVSNRKIASVKVTKKKIRITGKKRGKTNVTLTAYHMKKCVVKVVVIPDEGGEVEVVIPTSVPTKRPSASPYVTATIRPTVKPSVRPSQSPTGAPEVTASEVPDVTNKPDNTKEPSWSTGPADTAVPTMEPQPEPGLSPIPTMEPQPVETPIPTAAPEPGESEVPEVSPTPIPVEHPEASATAGVTSTPKVSATPEITPTAGTTTEPTIFPTIVPTTAPISPTADVTIEPTTDPTVAPTAGVTVEPTMAPTTMPTAGVTAEPTTAPTADVVDPTAAPTVSAAVTPTAVPTASTAAQPTVTPTAAPVTALETTCLSFGDSSVYIGESVDNLQVEWGEPERIDPLPQKDMTAYIYNSNSETEPYLLAGIKEQKVISYFTIANDFTVYDATVDAADNEILQQEELVQEGASAASMVSAGWTENTDDYDALDSEQNEERVGTEAYYRETDDAYLYALSDYFDEKQKAVYGFYAFSSQDTSKYNMMYRSRMTYDDQILRAAEKQVWEITNAYRNYMGKSLLQWEAKAEGTARAHSQDMADKNFFSHNSQDGTTCFQRMNNAGISYRSATENICAGVPDAIGMVIGWIGSSGHREDILFEVQYIGVGIAYNKSARYAIYATQDFWGR